MEPWSSTSVDYQHQRLKAVVAGGITGGLELLISYPFDYIKTQLQLAKGNDKGKGFNTFRDVITETVKKRGVSGLYRGLPILLIFGVPRESVRFGVYETLKELTLDDRGNIYPAHMRFFCGLGAGSSEAVIVTVMETIKVKFIRDQLEEQPKYKGIFVNGIFKIVKEQGIKGVYQGFTLTLIKQGSNQAMRFYVVETMKFRYRSGDPSIKIPPLVVGSFGVIAGVVSVLANNPVDVMKTRMQGYGSKSYKSTFDCAKKIFMEEGVHAFYKGMTARVIRVGLDSGFTFMCYDTVAELLQPFFEIEQ